MAGCSRCGPTCRQQLFFVALGRLSSRLISTLQPFNPYNPAHAAVQACRPYTCRKCCHRPLKENPLFLSRRLGCRRGSVLQPVLTPRHAVGEPPPSDCRSAGRSVSGGAWLAIRRRCFNWTLSTARVGTICQRRSEGRVLYVQIESVQCDIEVGLRAYGVVALLLLLSYSGVFFGVVARPVSLMGLTFPSAVF